MDIHYRILGYNPNEHSIEVRYWTDDMDEFDLCSLFNDNGNPMLTEDGYPVRCRTDVNITIYDTPSPDEKRLKTIIMNNAPINWFRLLDDVRSNSVDTSLSCVCDKLKQKQTFTIDVKRKTM